MREYHDRPSCHHTLDTYLLTSYGPRLLCKCETKKALCCCCRRVKNRLAPWSTWMESLPISRRHSSVSRRSTVIVHRAQKMYSNRLWASSTEIIWYQEETLLLSSIIIKRLSAIVNINGESAGMRTLIESITNADDGEVNKYSYVFRI